jgi:riboflavin synthase
VFTGVIIELGEVVLLKKRHTGAVLTAKAPEVSRDAAIGDSISVNGVCLTVVTRSGDILSFDLSDETLRSTNLGRMKPKDKVNLEPSLRPEGKLGGHFVTGHVDGIGTIRSKTVRGDMLHIVINASHEITGYLVKKGSVAVDGISLTVVEVFPDSFSVVIIPHTADVTTIGSKGVGDSVNLEADIIGKYVARFLAGAGQKGPGGEGSFGEMLVRAGYMERGI